MPKLATILNIPDGHWNVPLCDQEPERCYLRINEPLPFRLQNYHGISRMDLYHFIAPNLDEKGHEPVATLPRSQKAVFIFIPFCVLAHYV